MAPGFNNDPVFGRIQAVPAPEFGEVEGFDVFSYKIPWFSNGYQVPPPVDMKQFANDILEQWLEDIIIGDPSMSLAGGAVEIMAHGAQAGIPKFVPVVGNAALLLGTIAATLNAQTAAENYDHGPSETYGAFEADEIELRAIIPNGKGHYLDATPWVVVETNPFFAVEGPTLMLDNPCNTSLRLKFKEEEKDYYYLYAQVNLDPSTGPPSGDWDNVDYPVKSASSSHGVDRASGNANISWSLQDRELNINMSTSVSISNIYFPATAPSLAGARIPFYIDGPPGPVLVEFSVASKRTNPEHRGWGLHHAWPTLTILHINQGYPSSISIHENETIILALDAGTTYRCSFSSHVHPRGGRGYFSQSATMGIRILGRPNSN